MLSKVSHFASCRARVLLAPRLGLAFRTVAPSFASSSSVSSSKFSTATSSTSSSSTSSKHGYDYDLVVIGGGSGGLAAAKEATAINPNAKVLVFDFVQPSLWGTRWGLGGTCVNVGCVPKKLMHYSALLGHSLDHAKQFGWQNLDGATHDWSTMSTAITDYIRSLNFIYRSGLRGANVKYEEAYARFEDAHTLSWRSKTNKQGRVTADKVLIATGGRPNRIDVPGQELCMTSDDIFWQTRNPGKTLVIGAGYIALECAGFLHHLGNDVSVMVRSDFMRKFDRQASQQVGELMERDGIRFLLPASPLSFAKRPEHHPKAPAGSATRPDGVIEYPPQPDGKVRLQHPSGALETIDPKTGKSTFHSLAGPIQVRYKRNDSGAECVEEFDSVLLAIGRHADIEGLNLQAAAGGVRTHGGKVLVDAAEQTSVPNIFAIGDVAVGIPQHGEWSASHLKQHASDRPELTPVAIMAGKKLARRLFGQSTELMNYQQIPTTVFTPDEYGFIGLTQEQAEADEKDGGIGKENVEVFYSRFGSLEISPTHPHIKTPRSRVFLGKNLWMRKYTRANGLNWAESGMVLDSIVKLADGRVGKIVAEQQAATSDGKIQFVFDIELDNDAGVVKGVPEAQLELDAHSETENAELFVKANCLAKLVCDKRHKHRVVGLHYIGPNAGELLQGFAFALKFGATKDDFDQMVGIHPTCAEEFTVLSVTKSSGKTMMKKAGCGGGSCG